MTVFVSLYVWSIGGLYFILLCLISIFLSFFLRPEKFDPWIKKSLKFLFAILFIKVQSKGKEFIAGDKNYLFMSNHVSLFDIPLLEAYIPIYVRGVEALRQFKWPIYGWAIRRLGNIPIDRKNIHASIRSMKKTRRILEKGKSMVVLPEGHRTLDGKIGEFKKLPFHLAKEAGVPIIPIGLSGLFQLKRKGSWIVRPQKVSIAFGKPIHPEQIDALSIEDLRYCVRDRIQALINEPGS